MFPEIVRREVGSAPVLPGVSPVLSRIYAARGVTSPSDLDYGLERLPPFETLAGMAEAVEVLAEAITAGARILVVGDYDADGATSTALAKRALTAMGAARVDVKVPNRFTDGYGLTPRIVSSIQLLEPAVLLTVDNGIASVDGVARARAAGMKVVVTDHHLPGPELPEADAIVNPNLPADGSELGNLAGVGVVFLLMVALRAALRKAGWFAGRGGAEPNLADLLDLVALGTVADVVPLDHPNRLLVHQGLRRIRAGRCQPGLAALAELAGRRLERIGEADLGYVLGPRLNAAGRLEDMVLGIECLLADEPAEARRAAKRLDGLNRERRSIERRMEEEALEALVRLDFETAPADLPAALCLWEEGWHQGVVGILASRLKDRLHRPVVAFAPGDDGELRGSARSVEAVHIRDAIENVANRFPGLVPRFGGHAMAAGLSLARERFEEFRQALEAEVDRVYPPEARRRAVETDGELGDEHFEDREAGLELANEIRHGGPWGRGFPQPRFDGRFEVVDRRVVGGRHLKLRLRRPGGDRIVDAIAFRHDDRDWPPDATAVEAVYRLEVDEYRGVERPQLVVRHLRVV